jgi:hypothetical protein
MSTVVASPGDRLVTLPEGLPELTLGWEAQLRFLLWWYALDEDGQWLFHHGVRRLAKGSGKSPFAAVLALIEFCAPVRLDDFDDRAGWLSGKPVTMPLVQIAATAESQTANTMRMVRAFAPKGSRRSWSTARLDPGKTKYYKLPEGTLEVITSSSDRGGRRRGVVRRSATRPSTGSRRTAAELARRCRTTWRSPGPGCWRPRTPGCPASESVAESTWDAWVAQEEGRTRGESRILYDARIAPPDTDMTTRLAAAALEFVYDDCWWQKSARSWSASGRRREEDDSKRKYLNWPTVARDAWTTPEAWALLADRPRCHRRRGGRAVLRRLEVPRRHRARRLLRVRRARVHRRRVGAEPGAQHRRRRPGRRRRPRGPPGVRDLQRRRVLR